MKQQFIRHTFLKLLLLGFVLLTCAGEAWGLGENTSYVLNDGNEYSIFTINTSKSFQMSGPGKTLSFEAHKDMASVQGLYVEYSNDNNNWQDLAGHIEVPATTWSLRYGTQYNWKTFTYTLPNTNIRYIRFRTKGGATLTKYFRKIKVTRATTLSDVSDWVFTYNYLNPQTRQFSVDYNNTTYNQTLSASRTNNKFSISPASVQAGQYGSQSYTITFTPATNQAPGSVETGTVTVSMTGNSTSKTFNVSATYIPKSTVTFDSNGGTSPQPRTKTVTYNENYGQLPSVNRTGYTFLGWYTVKDAGQGSEVTASTKVTASTDHTLYAHWAPYYNFEATAGYVTATSSSWGWAVSATVSHKTVQCAEGTTSHTVSATFTADNPSGGTFMGWYTTSDIHTGTRVSTDRVYTTNITNSTPGTTATLPLYAYYKHNQSLAWDDAIQTTDTPLVKDVTPDFTTSAHASSGLQVTYTSSNSSVLGVNSAGELDPKAVTDEVCISASQDGNDSYNAAAPIVRCFRITEKKYPIFNPGNGTTFNMKVGDTQVITILNVSADLNGDFTVSAGTSGIVSWTRTGTTLTITALQEGNTTLTLTQRDNREIYGASATYTIHVTRIANTLALTETTKSMYVDDVWEDVVTGKNSNAPLQVTYSTPNIVTYDRVNNTITANNAGTTTVTFSQDQNVQYTAAIKSVTITVSRIANTLSANISPTSLLVDQSATVNYTLGNNTTTQVDVNIVNQSLLTPTLVNPAGNDVIVYDKGTIEARNAGQATVVLSQAESRKYTAAEFTFTITVGKHNNVIKVNGSTAYSASLNYASTQGVVITSDNDGGSAPAFAVSASSDADVATYSGAGASGTITTYHKTGSASWTVTQAEDYKYNAGSTILSVSVAPMAENTCYVVDRSNEESAYHGDIYTYTLDGPGSVLTFEARRNTAGFPTLSVYTSVNGSNYTLLAQYWATSNPSLGTEFSSYSVPITQDVRYIKFTSADGALYTARIRNVKVTRKTYLNRTPSSLNFGTILLGNTSSKTFNVEWSSSNTGNILIASSDPTHFTVTPNIISNTDCASGTQTITVTYHGTDVGTHTGTITIYDKGRKTTVSVTGTTREKYNLIIEGSDESEEVGSEWDAGFEFRFEGTSAPVGVPTHGIGSSHFYYTFTTTLDDNTVGCDPNHTNDVVTYDAANNLFHAWNAGTAVITFHETGSDDVYARADVSFTITVTKHEPSFTWTLNNAEWCSQYKFSDYFSSTNTSSSWSAVSNTDIAEYRSVTDSIYTNYRTGTATFTITQVENYYWDEKVQTVSTNVAHGEENVCYLYESPANQEIKVWDFEQATWQDTAVAGKVVFEAMRGPADLASIVGLKVFQTLNGENSQIGNMITDQVRNSYKSYERDLNSYATGLTFENWFDSPIGDGIDFTNRVKNVKVTRLPWIKASSTDITLPTIGKHGYSEATVVVSWSGVEPLRIEQKTNNSHFTISPDNYFVQVPCTSGASTITIGYHNTQAITDETETIVIYDRAKKLEITLHATTEDKDMQEIVWNQWFNPILAGNGTIDADSTLTAYAVDIDGNPTGQPITYSVADPSIATIENGNHLHIVSTGSTTVTANVAGNASYGSASKTLTLNVLDGNGCGSYAYSSPSEVSLFTITSDNAMAVTRPAEDLYFEARRDAIAIFNPSAQHVRLRYKVAGDNNWKTTDVNGTDLTTGALKSDFMPFGPYRLPENTVSIQFYTETGAYFSQHVRNVYITQKTYLLKDKDELTATVCVNSKDTVGKFTVSYSDKPTLSITNKCSNITLVVDNPAPNKCGDAGTYTYDVLCQSDTLGVIKDTITITSGLEGDLMIIPVTVTVVSDGEYFFDNGASHNTSNTDWQVSQYWRKDNLYNHGSLPSMGSIVTIEGPTVIDGEAYAYQMIITGSGSVTIAPTGSLTVGAGGISGTNEFNLVLQASNSGATRGQTGVLRMYPGITPPKALVQLYSVAKNDYVFDKSKSTKWQHIGSPVQVSDQLLESFFLNCWLYRWDETLSSWDVKGNYDRLYEFQAYCFSQREVKVRGIVGTLAAPVNRKFHLTKTSSGRKGKNRFTNSFSAPIDVRGFDLIHDFTDGNDRYENSNMVYKTIYIYNTIVEGEVNDMAGKYTAIPIGLAQMGDYTGQVVIPSMQVFQIVTDDEAYVNLDYRRLVYDRRSGDTNVPLRAPQRVTDNDESPFGLTSRITMDIHSNSSNDELNLYESPYFTSDYDNGFDAYLLSPAGVYLYAQEPFGKAVYSCKDNLNGTIISLRTTADTTYTISFRSVLGEGLYLHDVVTDEYMEIYSGNAYTFSAEPDSTYTMRFQITDEVILHGGTSLDNGDDNAVSVWTDDAILFVTHIPEPTELYLYDSTGKLIHKAPVSISYSYNMSGLPVGTYMVRVGSSVSKVIR